jgi:hypothetical protein
MESNFCRIISGLVPKFDHPLTPILVLNKFGPNHPGISKNRRDSAKVSVNAKWHNRNFEEMRSQKDFGNESNQLLGVGDGV